MTRISLLCERIIEAGWLAAIVTVPLYFNIYSSRVFEPDKITALRCIVAFMALAFVIKTVEERVLAKSLNGGIPSAGALWKALRAENPLAFPTLVLCLSLIVSTVGSVSPWVSLVGSYQRLQGTFTWLTYVTLFLLVAHHLRTRVQLNRLITVMILTSLPVALYGLAQHQRLDPLPWGGDVVSRVASSMGNPIFLAAYLIMVLPLAVVRLIDSLRRLESRKLPRISSNWWVILGMLALIALQNLVIVVFVANTNKAPNLWWGAFGIVAITLNLGILVRVSRPSVETALAETIGYASIILVQLTTVLLAWSRGPYLGLGAGMSVLGLVLVFRYGPRWLQTTISAAIGCMVALLIVFNAPNSPLAPFRDLPYIGKLGAIWETEGGTGKVRLLIWQGAVELMTRPPSVGLVPDPLNTIRPLIGYGPEAMYVAFNKVYPPDLAHYEARNASPDRSHQASLDLLVNTGVIGFAAFFFLLFCVFKTAWGTLRKSEMPYFQLIIVAAISVIVSHFVESQVGIPIASTLTYLWVMFGVVVAIGNMQRTEPFPVQLDGGAAISETGMSLPKRDAGKFDSPGRIKRQKGKGAVPPLASTQAAISRARVGDGVAWQFSAFFVFLSAVALLILAEWPPFQDMWPAFVGGFAWLLVGILAAAASLGNFAGIRGWGAKQLWIHIPATAVAVVFIIMNLTGPGADIFYKRGYMFETQQHWDDALLAYRDALNLSPDQDFYYLFLGRLFMEMSKTNSRPKVTPPVQIDLAYIRALSPRDLQRLGKEDLLEASRVSLEQARIIAPLNTDHSANLGRLYRFWAGSGDRAKFDLSLKYYSDALKLSPQAVHLWDEWAEVYLAIGQVDVGIEKLEIARKLDAQYPLTFVYLGDAYMSAKKPQEALEAHSRVLALDPVGMSDQRLEARINFYLDNKIADRLVPLYAQAAAKSPNSAPVRSAFGYLLSRLGNIQGASTEFEAWVGIAPKDWVARRNLALSYQNLGKTDLAIRQAEEARNLAPQDQKESLEQWVTQLNQMRKP